MTGFGKIHEFFTTFSRCTGYGILWRRQQPFDLLLRERFLQSRGRLRQLETDGGITGSEVTLYQVTMERPNRRRRAQDGGSLKTAFLEPGHRMLDEGFILVPLRLP